MNDFERRMAQVEFDDALGSARALLGAGNHEAALYEARRAATIPGVTDVGRAYDLIAEIEAAAEKARVARDEQVAREAQEQGRRRRQATSGAASGASRFLALLGKLALLLSVGLIARPLYEYRSFLALIQVVDYRSALAVFGVLVAFYTITAYNWEAYPTGSLALPFVWSLVFTFFMSSASVIQANMSSSYVWKRWIIMGIAALVILYACSKIGSALRKARG